MEKRFNCEVKIEKVDESQGVVFGWAIVSEIDGKPYFDLQGDHIPPAAMLKASVGFFKSARMADEMHDFESMGTVLFGFPMTAEIAKSMGIVTQKTGLMIGMAPSKDVLAKFADGTYTGFSIGGRYVATEAVED